MTPGNDEQVAFWNGPSGERWVIEQRERDAMLAPFGNAAMDAADVGQGAAVLDVGCGCGTTSLLLAERVGAGGRVVGIDLSAPMIARATQRAAGRSNLSFVVADASAVPVETGAFDVLYSRFGVMFFSDPVGAFTQLRASLKRGGRVSFVCWRALADNPWAKIPYDVTVQIVGAPPPSPPDAPGPFAFADEARVRSILERAGFGSIALAKHDATAIHGTLDEAAKHVATMGPASRLLADRDEETVTRVLAGTRAAIAPYVTERGVVLPGAVWGRDRVLVAKKRARRARRIPESGN